MNNPDNIIQGPFEFYIFKGQSVVMKSYHKQIMGEGQKGLATSTEPKVNKRLFRSLALGHNLLVDKPKKNSGNDGILPQGFSRKLIFAYTLQRRDILKRQQIPCSQC